MALGRSPLSSSCCLLAIPLDYPALDPAIRLGMEQTPCQLTRLLMRAASSRSPGRAGSGSGREGGGQSRTDTPIGGLL